MLCGIHDRKWLIHHFANHGVEKPGALQSPLRQRVFCHASHAPSSVQHGQQRYVVQSHQTQHLADLLARHFAHLPLAGAPLAAGVQGVVATLDRTAWGRRFAERSAERFPLGYFMVAEQPAGAA